MISTTYSKGEVVKTPKHLFDTGMNYVNHPYPNIVQIIIIQ